MTIKTLILGLGLAVLGSASNAIAQTTFTPANANKKVKTMQMNKHNRVVQAHSTTLRTASEARMRTNNRSAAAKKAKLTKAAKVDMRMERKAMQLRHKQLRMSTIK